LNLRKAPAERDSPSHSEKESNSLRVLKEVPAVPFGEGERNSTKMFEFGSSSKKQREKGPRKKPSAKKGVEEKGDKFEKKNHTVILFRRKNCRG